MTRRWPTPWRRRSEARAPDCGGLSCREMVELITDYFEDALPGETRARFEAHIATCDACTKYVEQMRVTMSVVGHVGAAGLDPRVEQELLDAFRDWKAGA